MKKKEVVNILKPYWVEYLKNNGEFERELQLKKFVNSFNGLGRFGFFSLLNITAYLNFKISAYLLRKKFWKFSKAMAEFKEAEEKLDALKTEFKESLTAQDIRIIEEKKAEIQISFKKLIVEYFESTLGSTDREVRLWSANEILNAIKD